MFNPLKINVMKKEIDLKNKENYVAPEMEVVVLAAEQKVLSSSNEGVGDDEDI